MGFELGVTYQCKSTVFFAISDVELVTVKKGVLVRVTPNKPSAYKAQRGYTVEDLEDFWDLDGVAVDRLLGPFFRPREDGRKIRTRPRGHKGEELAALHHREQSLTVRVRHPGRVEKKTYLV